MKKKYLVSLFTCLFLLSTFSVSAQDADKILGTYMTEDKDGKVTITKHNDKYYGTLIWVEKANALDDKNPDKSKRKNKLVGTVILKDFVYKSNGSWEGGTVYDPKSGKTYSGTITLNKNGNLNMRGYVGISMFGRTSIWTKIK